MRLTPVVAPRPVAEVLEAPLGDGLALFHLTTRRLHLLNGSAAAVWAVLPQAATVAELTVVLGDRYGIAPGDLREDVETVLARLRRDGLVTIDDRPPMSAPARPHRSPRRAAVRDGVVPAIGSFAALDARVALECHDPELREVLCTVLAPLRTAAPPDTIVRIVGGGDHWELTVGDRPTVTLSSPLAVVLRALGEINDVAVASVPDDLVFHAGAVAGPSGAVLLPGAANRGKSTLTTALVRAGYEYLTDEAAAITAVGSVRPFPKSIALDPGSFPLFPDLAPDSGGELAGTLAGREWHVAPDRVGRVGRPTPVVAVVCPHWRPGAATRLVRLPRTEALHRLLGDAFDFTAGGGPVFERLVGLVRDVPVHRLGYGELDEAVEVVGRLLG